MQLSIGPYIILGRLHAPPGQDPMKNVLQREPMIPLTGVTMAYTMAGAAVARDLGTVIVNRHQVEWITATDDGLLFPEATVRSPTHDEPAQGLHRTVHALGPRAGDRRRCEARARVPDRSRTVPRRVRPGAPAMRETT